MGQINSTRNDPHTINAVDRNQSTRPSDDAREAISSASHSGNASAPSRPGDSTSLPGAASVKRSRREAVRQSFLGLIRPRSSSRLDERSSPSAQVQKKKRWGISRRRSKAPTIPAVHPTSGDANVGAESRQRLQEGLTTSIEERVVTSPEASAIFGDGRIIQPTTVIAHDRPRAHMPMSPPDSVQSPSPPASTSAVPTSSVDMSLPEKEKDTPAPADAVTQSGSTLRNEVEEQEVASDAETHGLYRSTTPTPVDWQTNPVNSVPVAQSQNTQPLSSTESAQEQPQMRQSPPQPQPRPFPPPGTLVIVQGVVHTSDPPRPSATPLTVPHSAATYNENASTQGDTSSSSPETAASSPDNGNARSRRYRSSTPIPGQRNSLLSTLLRNRNSLSAVSVDGANAGGSESDSSSGLPTADAGEPVTSGGSDSLRDDVSTPGSSSSTSASTAPSASGLAGNSGDGVTQAPARRPGQLSPNSIDVLGTLLSVATAATAASLVTGSADPFLRNAQANAHARASNASSVPTDQPSPSTPTAAPSASTLAGSPLAPGFAIPSIARALTNANPGAAAAVAQREREREESERHRMRSLWDGLRERLRGSNGPSASPGVEASPETDEAATVRPSSGAESAPPLGTETGAGTGNSNGLVSDALFSEITRAFNLGSRGSSLAQPPMHGLSPGESTGIANEGRNGEDPPPDSFERFLIDLQIDLREVLTRLDSSSGSDVGSPTEDEAEAPRMDGLRMAEAARAGGEREDDLTSSNVRVESGMEATTRSEAREENPVELATADDQQGQPTTAPALSSPVEYSGTPGNHTRDLSPTLPDTNTNAPLAVASEEYDDGDLPTLEPLSDADSSEGDDPFDHAEGEMTEGTLQHDVGDVISSSQPIALASGNIASRSSADQQLPEIGATANPITTTRGDATNGRGGVNWWRTYRFPPISMPQTGQPAAGATAASAPSWPASPAQTSMSPGAGPSRVQSPAAEGTSLMSSTSSQPTSESRSSQHTTQIPQTPDPNLVVPVIVVGLQSIGMGRMGTRPPNMGTGPSESPIGSDMNEDDTDSAIGPDSPDQARERSWQARAARAISRFGRRGGNTAVNDHGNEGNEGHESPGSRTFFIYVFGGYYPPNHHIVTGSDHLDSFEALWELAELLGQVKPPTATRDDIEKSGLKTFKASALSEYEQTGKVSNNCVDRCLVCLDDYEPDDDLRLMTCKHAFHKVCVDKWLETGRNNCPACRTKGVNTDNGRSPPESPTL